MKKNQIKILYSLLLRSSNLVLRISIFSLPLIIATSFASILFISNLSQSYENYLLKSYIGVQGVLTIFSEDTNYLQNLQAKYNKLNIVNSKKKTLRRKLQFLTDKYKIEKTISIIVLEEEYLKTKFKYTNQPIIINKVLKNILGSVSKLEIRNKKINKNIKIDNVKIIDTGFLTPKPLLFISKSYLNKIGLDDINYNSIEIDTTINKIIYSKKIAEILAENEAVDIIYKDMLSANNEIKELFGNIKYIEYLILAITIVLSFIILTGSLSIISKIKEKAISLLRIYGLSTNLISTSLTLICAGLLLLSLIIAFIIFEVIKYYFITEIGFDANFFILLDYEIIYFIAIIILVFLILTYLWGYLKFKGKIEL